MSVATSSFQPESRIQYVSEAELKAKECLCGETHTRDEYVQLPCRMRGGIVERSYMCPNGRVVSWCKFGPEGLTFGKL